MTLLSRIFRSESLLYVLWANELIRLIWAPQALQAASGWLMIAYAALSLRHVRSGTLILCLPLASIAAILATLFNQWSRVLAGFENAAVFMAFFGSIVLLRALADRRREISTARSLFDGLRPDQTNGAFLVGAHLIGSILVVGVMAILAPILKNDADDTVRRRAAEVSQRGMCLAPLWSPFWVASAFATQQIPNVPAWEIMALGLCMAAIGLVISHAMFARGVGFPDLWNALKGFAPILPAVALCALMIAALSGLAGLGTLKALIATVPVLALLTFFSARGRDIRETAAETSRGTGRVRDEIVVVTTALVLGRVLEAAITEAGAANVIEALTLPPWAVIAAVIAVMTAASLMCIHQLVSMIVVLVIFMPLDTGVSDVVMMEAALVGWAFASMVGVTAVSTATASAMFRIPRIQLIFGPNLYFVGIFGILSAGLLTIANRYLFGGG